MSKKNFELNPMPWCLAVMGPLDDKAHSLELFPTKRAAVASTKRYIPGHVFRLYKVTYEFDCLWHNLKKRRRK